MKKNDESFTIDKGLALGLAFVVLLRGILEVFFASKLKSSAFTQGLRTLGWGLFAASFFCLVIRFFKNSLGKAKRRMLLCLAALLIALGIIMLILSINQSALSARLVIDFLISIDGSKPVLGIIAIVFLLLFLVGTIGSVVLLAKEASTKSGFSWLFLAAIFSNLAVLVLRHKWAIILVGAVVIIINLASGSSKRKRRGSSSYYGTSSSSPSASSYSSTPRSTYSSTSQNAYSSSSGSQSSSGSDHHRDDAEIRRYEGLLENVKEDIKYKERALADDRSNLNSAVKNGGKSGLYTADEYRDMIRNTEYALDDLVRRKKEYENEIARLKRG